MGGLTGNYTSAFRIYEKLSTTKLKIDEAIILNEILNKTTDKIQQQKKKLIEDVIEKQNITNDEFQASCKNIFEKLMNQKIYKKNMRHMNVCRIH